MTIVFGSSTNSGVVTGVSTHNFNSPDISGTTPTLIVLVANRDDSSASDGEVTSITHNGQPLTKAVSNDFPHAAYLEAQIWYRINADAGVNTITVNYTGAITTGCAFASFFTGGDQSTVGDQTGGTDNTAASNTNPAVTLVTTHNGSIIFSVTYDKTGSDMTIAGGQTSIAQLSPNAGGDRAAAGYVIQPSAGSITPTWTTSPQDDWVMVSAEFLEAATPPAVTYSSPFTMMGV